MKPQMASESKKAQNVPCSLLTQEENQKIFYALGKQCTTLSTTVVQLFLTEEPYHSTWQKKHCGVLCFVKDCERRSYFMKLFDMDKCSWVWEQELYNQFSYKPACTFFHVFEADNSMGGFNFADNDEAHSFKTVIQKKLQMREERKKERRKTQQNVTMQSNASIIAARAKSQSSQSLANGKDKKERKKRKKITKDDIGTPSNFTHLQHVGWHPEKGFNIESTDQELEAFFNLAGVSDKDLNDAETRNFIYDFIANHGGVERAKQETELTGVKSIPPPVPVRDLPQTPRSNRTAGTRSVAPPPPPPPIHPPAFTGTTHSAPKLSNAPPPPPPPPPPPVPQMGVAAPPPPPPPPPPGMMSLPKVPPAGGGAARQPNPPPPPPMDNRSALLEQIKKGRELNHVEVNGNSDQENSGDDSRNALLNQIRRGVVLKAVSEDQKPAPPSSTPMDGLAGALARALLERSKAVLQTDESDTSEDDDGDDWE